MGNTLYEVLKMTNFMQGIAPDRFRELSTSARQLANEADGWLRSASVMMRYGDLTCAVDVLGLCQEVNEEMGLLSELTASKAIDIESAADGSDHDSARTAQLQRKLDGSLQDDTGRKITGAEVKAEMAEAVTNGDTAEIERLSELIWTQVAGLSESEARDFLEGVGTAAVFVAVEATDLPASKAVANFMSTRAFGEGNNSMMWDAPLITYLRNEYGLDITRVEEVQKYAQDKLLESSRVSGHNAKLILSVLPTEPLTGQAAAAKLLETIVLENPNEFASVIHGDISRGQDIADLLADYSSAATLNKIMEDLVSLAIQGYDPDGITASAAYQEHNFAGAAIFTRSLNAAGKALKFDLSAVIKFGLAKLGAAGKAVTTIDGFIEVDDTGKRRDAEHEREYVIRNLALTILGITDPDTAKTITTHIDMDKPLIDEWENVPTDTGDKELKLARERLQELETIVQQWWDEGSD